MFVRRFVAVFVCFLLLGASVVSARREVAAAAGEKGSKLGKADLVVTPAQWRADFKKDAKTARAKYAGKVVEMTGTIDSVRPEPFGAPYSYISFEVAGDFEGVRCVLSDPRPWLKVSPGSRVKVRGKSSDVVSGDLKPCEIVEVMSNPGVTVTAPELARQFAADRKGAQKKFDDKWANLKGDVVARSKSKFCVAVLTLKGAGDVTVNCCFGEAGKRGTEKIKVGAKVAVFGRLSVGPGAREKSIWLNSCFLTEAK
jgi:hypothetical protein